MNKINMKTRQYGQDIVTVFQIGNDRYNLQARILKHSMTNLAIIPIEICAIAAGKDKWIRDIVFICPDCGQEVKACDSESGNICSDCYEKAAKELDG